MESVANGSAGESLSEGRRPRPMGLPVGEGVSVGLTDEVVRRIGRTPLASSRGDTFPFQSSPFDRRGQIALLGSKSGFAI